MAIEATLGGVPLSLASGQVWTLQYGTAPYQRTFAVSRARAEAILAAKGPIEFVIKADGYPTLRVRGLYALQAIPIDENFQGVVVVDRRWKLSRKTVTRDYNIRRRTGDYRRVGNLLQHIQNKDVIADVAFRRSSLNAGKKWEAREILADILTELVGADGFDVGRTNFSVDLEGLILDRDRGDAALARVLSYIPGAAVYAGIDGRLHVVNKLNGSEAKAVAAAGPRYRELPGHVELIDRSKMRPETVRVQFEPEPEIRFNYSEDDPNPDIAERGREPRAMRNVLPVVDPSLAYTPTGENAEVTVTEGTWLSVHEWIKAVNAADDAPATAPESLSLRQFRQHYMSGFQHMRNMYVQMQQGLVRDATSLIWERRIAAIAAHFRRTFRIWPQWMDKLRSIRAVRSSILDQEKGTRGKAEAFFDYFAVPSRRALVKRAAQNRAIGFNVPGYAADLSNAASSPADVVIIDDEVGIIALNFKVDPWGDASKIIPGTMANPGQLLQVAAADPVLFSSLVEGVTLQTGWKLAVVLTVVTATPNDSSRLYTVDVGMGAAYALLGDGTTVPKKATGPTWTVGIGAGIETARFMWSYSERLNIENAVFGTVNLNAGGDEVPPVATWASLKNKLLTNRGATDALAKAAAARVHALLLDRWEGSQFVRLNPSLHPTGSMASVSHMVTGSGTVATQMSLPPILQAPDIYSLLPDSARKILQRQVQQ